MMAAITNIRAERPGFLHKLHKPYKAITWALSLVFPKGLYARALIIIIAPVVLLQSVVVFIFMERHWDSVTRRLSTATAQDIAMLVDMLPSYAGAGGYEQLTDLARERLNLVIQILPPQELPAARPRPFFGLLDKALSREIRKRVGRRYWIDTVGTSRHVEVRVKLDNGVLKVLAPLSQTYASNSHIFLVWMVATSVILLTVAIFFLRNQIKPILALADAADRFGKGRPAPKDFRIRGAREVRQAAQAFLEMRDRIERHVEQRTTMLAGVSHDLRTVLTRFRLQLAMLGNPAGEGALRADVDEMQQMLEDYMAFAKGDGGEKTKRVDMRRLLEEIRSNAALSGKRVTLEIRQEQLTAALRRNAFKRAILNLVSNATRFAGRIAIRAVRTRRWLTIAVEDDGPGIPADKREEVFRPFFSLDGSRNQDVKSTGLGLAIARDIIRGHGGDIVLGESAMGGLKALVRIPV